MTPYKFVLFPMLMSGLVACGSNNVSVGLDGDDDTEFTVVGDLRGTENPTAAGSIVRLHAGDPEDDYTLSADSVEVQDGGDTLIITGMPFDGDEDRYVSFETAGTNGDFTVYRNEQMQATDPLSGIPIGQARYLAVHQESADGLTYVTVVASTHNTENRNLEGFIYGRNGGVTLPTVNQAGYGGDYAGVRFFDDSNTTQVEYVSGTMTMAIDFENLNSPGALYFSVANRQAFDEDGNLLGNLTPIGGFAENFVIDPQGEFQAEGETGIVNAAVFDEDEGEYVANGTISVGDGTIHGVLAGDNAQTIVGTIVLEGGNYFFANQVWVDVNDNGINESVSVVGDGGADGDFYLADDTVTVPVNETGAFILER